MSLLFDLLKLYVVGIVVFAFFPAVLRPLPWGAKNGIIRTYTGMAMSVLGRGLLVAREHGGVVLKKTKFDARVGAGAELARIGGETKHWKDPMNFMSTFHGKPFGLAHEKKNIIVDARICHLARKYLNYKQQNGWALEIDDQPFRRAFFGMADGRALTQISDAMPVIQGSADPGIVDRIEEYGKIGNSMYNSTQMLQGIKFLTTFGGVFLLMWLGRKLMETTAGGSTLIPGMI